MKKTLNIELNVRRMEAQNILTASNIGYNSDLYDGEVTAPTRGEFTPYAGLEIRSGF